MSDSPYSVRPSSSWSDDPWYRDQDDRHLIDNPGWTVINEGDAEGIILGANLCTFNLLQGTEYFPDLNNSVLFVEDDYVFEGDPYEFDRNLQSLMHQPSFPGVLGIVIGRFQNGSKLPAKLLEKMIRAKKEISNIPIIVDVDFGHTDPKISFPIGGTVRMSVRRSGSKIEIVKH
jgi:muramoyltetrapeptide carboxypeptidase LdcA involved in peptidoglycan recycling